MQMTSKAAHTAGPWTASPIKRGFLKFGTSEVSEMKPAGYQITAEAPKMFGGTKIFDAEISEADARLIAAAPELLSAAMAVVEACNPIPLKSHQHIAFAELTNAINKAIFRDTGAA